MNSITEAGAVLRARQVSCLELVDEALRKAAAAEALNAFITITAEPAREQAKRLDGELAAGRDRGPLHGIPIALKDLFYTRGIRTTNGARIFSDFVPDFDADVVERLNAAGAVSIGKLNQHELAYGITSSNPHFGPVRNPHAHDRVPGGSSGGSGAAVAADIVYMAMGSDTGGSIRIPAAFCGTVGLKPTFDLVSRHGCFPLALTLDHMGPLTRSVRDAEIALNAIASDASPSTGKPLSEMRIGCPKNFYTERLDEDVRTAMAEVWTALSHTGARIVPVRVPDVEALNTVARTILLAEASAVMTPHLHRRDEFGSDVLALLDAGSLLRATDYVNAQRLRRVFQREWRNLFDNFDILVTPTTAIAAPPIGADTLSINGVEEDTRLAATRFVRGINALGYPALSIPCGKSREGLPIGLQLIARPFHEKLLLSAGAEIEALLGVATEKQ